MRSRPLKGRTIVVTRPKEQAGPFAESLRRAGARVVVAPAIRIAPPSSYKRLDAALRHLGRYHDLVFTSRNAVERFFARVAELQLVALPRPERIFAIGPGTAAALSQHGWKAQALPETRRGEALARTLGKVRGRRVLIPRARFAREALPRLLRARGARVCVVEAYQTVREGLAASVLRRVARADAVTFTSASTVEHFLGQLDRALRRRLFRTAAAVSIGPITSRALRARGLRPVEARRADAEGLLERLADHFAGARR